MTSKGRGLAPARIAAGGSATLDAAAPGAPGPGSAPEAAAGAPLGGPYKDAKNDVLSKFTRDYLVALLDRHHGNVSAAPREAELDRDWIVQLARRHGIRLRGVGGK